MQFVSRCFFLKSLTYLIIFKSYNSKYATYPLSKMHVMLFKSFLWLFICHFILIFSLLMIFSQNICPDYCLILGEQYRHIKEQIRDFLVTTDKVKKLKVPFTIRCIIQILMFYVLSFKFKDTMIIIQLTLFYYNLFLIC